MITDQAPPTAAFLEQLLEFDTLISDLSLRFVNRTPGEVDREIDDALPRVCQVLGIDFAVLWQWSSANPPVVTPTHVYRAEKSGQPPVPLRMELFPWVRQEVLEGRVVAISSLEEAPADAGVDRENARLMGIKSKLTLPLSVGGEPPVGLLDLNTLRAERDWRQELVKRLQLVAQVLSNALARKRHALNLQRTEARLQATADLAGLAFYEADFGKRVMFLDDRLRELCGIPAEREQGLQALEFWMEHLHPGDRDRVSQLHERLLDGGLDRLSIEYRFQHPVHGEKWIQHACRVATRDANGLAAKSYGVLLDITEQKRAEEERRDLGRSLILAHEEERAMLARELHDDLTQRLAVLAIEVGRAELAAQGVAQMEALRVVREGLVHLSEDVHALAYQLHPSVLEELGLGEALRAECERIGREGRIELSVQLDPLPTKVGKDPALCLFRVAQEALNNISRHASACNASITLRRMDGGLLLAVRDDGVGFDPASAGKKRSLGLVSMRERVHLVNGTLDIESAPRQGTVIVAWVPLDGSSA